MFIITVFLFVFWVFVFVAAGIRIYEVIKYRDPVSFKEWVLMIGGLIMPVLFYIDRY
jgi:hypothetical protein